jgi:ketosteroid isomerase-like protein
MCQTRPRGETLVRASISDIMRAQFGTNRLTSRQRGGGVRLPPDGVFTVVRENGPQTNALIGVLVVASVLSALGAARAQQNRERGVEQVIQDFLVAFGNRDLAVFVPYFSEDATVFFPPSAAAPLGRVQGRSEIERTFKTIFDAYPRRSTAPATPIAPQDLLIQELDGHAVVTFHLGNQNARQRRTFVLKRVGGEWKIVHLHGSAAEGQP